MRTRELNVPSEIIVDFAKLLEKHEIINEIKGVTEDDEITVELQYEKEESEVVFELMELVDDYLEENEDDE